jgi:Predicted membrane protein (DUF2154).
MEPKRNLFFPIAAIIVGCLWLLKDLDFIPNSTFRLVLSWQCLLMYVGVYQMAVKKKFDSGIIVFLVGLFFLLPKMTFLGDYWHSSYWPLALVIGGVILLLKPRKKLATSEESYLEDKKTTWSNGSGYIKSDCFLGSVKHIVLDPVFKGAKITNALGSTVLDLRHTKLEEKETYLEIDCLLGGVDVYVPSNWNVNLQATSFLGGCEDKRINNTAEIDFEHTLIIRGSQVLGSIEIK